MASQKYTSLQSRKVIRKNLPFPKSALLSRRKIHPVLPAGNGHGYAVPGQFALQKPSLAAGQKGRPLTDISDAGHLLYKFRLLKNAIVLT